MKNGVNSQLLQMHIRILPHLSHVIMTLFTCTTIRHHVAPAISTVYLHPLLTCNNPSKDKHTHSIHCMYSHCNTELNRLEVK